MADKERWELLISVASKLLITRADVHQVYLRHHKMEIVYQIIYDIKENNKMFLGPPKTERTMF